MNALAAWLKSRNVSAHTVSVIITTAAALVVTDADFRNALLEFFKAHPKIGTEIVALCGIIVTYMKAMKGQVK